MIGYNNQGNKLITYNAPKSIPHRKKQIYALPKTLPAYDPSTVPLLF